MKTTMSPVVEAAVAVVAAIKAAVAVVAAIKAPASSVVAVSAMVSLSSTTTTSQLYELMASAYAAPIG